MAKQSDLNTPEKSKTPIKHKHICGVLRDLIPLYNFKNVKNTQWKSVNFSKVAKLTLLHGCFSHFF